MKKLHKVCTALLSLTLMACTACTPVETNAPVENSLTGANIGVTAPVEPISEHNLATKNSFSRALAAMNNGTLKKIGDTVQVNCGDKIMEYTVQDVQIFDHYTESGIPKSEFVFGLSDEPFILVEVKVKKVSGMERIDEDHMDSLTLSVLNRDMLEEEVNGNSVCRAEICYFSGHGEIEESGKKYHRYWLNPGEEAVYQLGWCVHEPWPANEPDGYLNNTEDLVLNISPQNWGEGEYIDLCTEK